jgi:hypothetical protein
MKLVALNKYFVVAIEQNGSINLDVEHDQIISAPDNAEVALGWTYAKPPFPDAPVRWFFSGKVPEGFVPEPVLVYQDDGNGNPVLVENPEETA